MLANIARRGLTIKGWQIEAAMNTYYRKTKDADGVKFNRSIGKLMMQDVVNVGSRVKAGGMTKGIIRMASIHGQALWGLAKF